MIKLLWVAIALVLATQVAAWIIVEALT